MGRRHHLRAALLGCIAALSPIAAPAQDVTIELPNIDVTSSRLGTGAARKPARERAPRVQPAPAPPVQPGAGEVTVELPSGIVTDTTITGASTTVITATDIERASGQTVQDVLARQPGPNGVDRAADVLRLVARRHHDRELHAALISSTICSSPTRTSHSG